MNIYALERHVEVKLAEARAASARARMVSALGRHRARPPRPGVPAWAARWLRSGARGRRAPLPGSSAACAPEVR